MRKISALTDTADSAGEFTDGSVASGLSPTILPADWFNVIQRELVAVVEGGGLTLDSSNDAQLLAALQALFMAKDGAALPLSGGTLTGELVSTSANALRMVSGDYGFLTRFDGSNYYLLITDSGDQEGTWSDLRPLTIDASTGAISLSTTKVAGTLTATGKIYSNAAYFDTVGDLYGSQWGGLLSTYLSSNYSGKGAAITSMRLGAQTSMGTTDGSTDVEASSGYVVTGRSGSNGDVRYSLWYIRPVQYYINGTWYTAASS